MSYARIRRKFATSPTLSQKGVWVKVDLGDGGPPPEFLIARMGSTNYRWSDMAAQSFRENRKRIDAGVLPAEESRLKAITTFAYTVLLDWKNIDDDDGNQILYTPEEGIKMLTEMDVLYDYLLEESQDITLFQDEHIKRKVGNLKSI